MSQVNDILISSNKFILNNIFENDFKTLFKNVNTKGKNSETYKDKTQSGLGLGIFIGKNLLEKNFASLNCQNSKTRTGAEVNIRWKNQDLKKI